MRKPGEKGGYDRPLRGFQSVGWRSKVGREKGKREPTLLAGTFAWPAGIPQGGGALFPATSGRGAGPGPGPGLFPF